MTEPRRLIVNADDFGLSAGVNRGIVEAHEHGIVTSASLMVRWPAATEAAVYGRSHPSLSVGLHVDLGEWSYRGNAWQPLYEVVPLNDPRAIKAEIERQIDLFQQLMGRAPTHIDSHQHVHRDEPVHTTLTKIARSLLVPLRHFTPSVQYFGGFYGQDGKGSTFSEAVSPAALIRMLADLPAGITELGCHPGYEGDFEAMYTAERAMEVHTLRDPAVRAALAAESIQLCSFHEIALL